MKGGPKNFVYLILGLLFFFNILAWIAVFDLSQPNFLEVTFFDVGQGDAIFVETPQSHQILIDGGPSSVILENLGKEMSFWDRTIDLIILTHPEHDHLVGLIEVLKRYRIDYIFWTGVIRDTAEYEEWQRLIQEEAQKEKAKIKIAQAGQKITWSGSHPDQYIEVLYPLENLIDQEFKNSNNTSIVSRLVFNQSSFLFTGDAYKSVEYKLINQGVNINSDVLKIGHHGSKTSSGEKFIAKVSPEIAVIQVGENRYGHPHQETLETLGKYDITVLRTDKDRDVKIISDGIKLKLK